ncbi:MAG: hypothetical protein JWN36_2663 [Microbacteriaceae bacterium]|nr:hypothetical protein [Microbacteriaceae bacterium]
MDGVLARTVAALEEAGVGDEALGVLVPARRFRGEVIKPAGRAWRLGALLLARDGTLYATGEVTRAVEPLRGVANKSPDAEARREKRRAAVRGRFADGEVVNFGYTRLDAVPEMVGVVPVERYLAERVALHIEQL